MLVPQQTQDKLIVAFEKLHPELPGVFDSALKSFPHMRIAYESGIKLKDDDYFLFALGYVLAKKK